jgi:gliding motility-associated-like protein
VKKQTGTYKKTVESSVTKSLLLSIYLAIGSGFVGFSQNHLIKEVEISFCESNIVPIDLNKAIGFNFPEGTGFWYNESREVVSNIFLPLSEAKDLYEFYFLVENANVSCDLHVDDRYVVRVRRNIIPTPQGEADQFFCADAEMIPVLADLQVEGEMIQWYDKADGGTKLDESHVLKDGTIYYAAEREPGCGESSIRLAVTAHIDITPNLVIQDPGPQQPGYELANLVIEDLNGASGELTFHSSKPQSADDMSNSIEEEQIYESQTLYVMKATKNGCYDVKELRLVIEACDFELQADITHVKCFGDETGSIDLSLTSADDLNFEYSWSNGETGSYIENLPAGTYAVTVKPDNSCHEIYREFTIVEPEELQLTIKTVKVSKAGNKDGKATALVEGGMPDYLYQWDDVARQQTATAILLEKGKYTVVVSDENGCEVTGTALVDENLLVPDGFSPNGDGINEKFVIAGMGEYPDAYLEVVNRWGQIVFKRRSYGNESRWGAEDAWWDGRSNSKLGMGNGILPAGTYIYFLKLSPESSKVIKGTIFINR